MTEDKIGTKLDAIREQIVLLRIDVATLKVKAGIWGFAAGLIPAIGIIIVSVARGKL